LALAALALVVFGAYDSYPTGLTMRGKYLVEDIRKWVKGDATWSDTLTQREHPLRRD